MAELLRNNPLTNFSLGFFYPFHSARLLLKHPGLLRFIIIPFVINCLVFSAAVYFGLDFFRNIVVNHIPQGDAWYWIFLYYVAWIVAVLLTAVLVFFTFTVVGNLIASPFNDLLSERTEELLTGQKHEEPFSLRTFWQDSRRTLAVEVKKILLFVFAMLAILPLNLLPVFGSVLYTVLVVLLTIFFLVVEYIGIVLARKRMVFREQRRFIFARTFLMLGFGTGVLTLLAIPLMQFLCIPVAVVAATKLFCDLQRARPQGEPVPVAQPRSAKEVG